MKTDNSVSNSHIIYRTMSLAAVVILALIISGCGRRSHNIAMDDYNKRVNELSRTNQADLLYAETSEYTIKMDQVRGIAVDRQDNIYVVGDRSIIPFTSTGSPRPPILQEYAPYAIAVDNGNLYVAMQDHVRVFTTRGVYVSVWDSHDLDSRFCSISCNGSDVFIGDAGNRVVLHYNTEGTLLGVIGKGHFVAPSRHLDVCAVSNGSVWAVNPGKHTIALYNNLGSRSKSWGISSLAAKGFSGCCNPTDIALTKDGGFITSEKGIPRIKLYDKNGKFVCIIAPPEAFDSTSEGLDVAVDSKGRVLVLDTKRKSIRVFERRRTSKT